MTPPLFFYAISCEHPVHVHLRQGRLYISAHKACIEVLEATTICRKLRKTEVEPSEYLYGPVPLYLESQTKEELGWFLFWNASTDWCGMEKLKSFQN